MRLLVVLLLLATLLHAEFVLREVNVQAGDIQKDGSAHIRESIRFLVIGDYAKALYESGFDRNDLTFWADATGLKDVKLHLDPRHVNIPPAEFALRPQPLRDCNPNTNLCQGELVLDYNVYPYYHNDSTSIPGSGLFSVNSTKPRTRYYILNLAALSFTSTAQGDIRLEQDVHFTLQLPQGAVIASETDLNPPPAGFTNARYPLAVSALSWANLVLVKFNVAFTVEDSLDKEVVDFSGAILQTLSQQARGEQGIAILLILLIMLGGYLYLQQAKRKVG